MGIVNTAHLPRILELRFSCFVLARRLVWQSKATYLFDLNYRRRRLEVKGLLPSCEGFNIDLHCASALSVWWVVRNRSVVQ